MNNQIAQPRNGHPAAQPLPPPAEEPDFATAGAMPADTPSVEPASAGSAPVGSAPVEPTSTVATSPSQQPGDLSLQSQRVSPNFGKTEPDIALQLAQIKHFFEKHWRPPANLRQPLEYRLFLAKDGTLQGKIPLTPLAGQYLQLIKMPALQQPFVSPFPADSKPIVRLILRPDGQVEAILEQF